MKYRTTKRIVKSTTQRKRIANKAFGIALACLMVGAMFGALPSTASAAQSPPLPPTAVSPGSSSAPGPVINTLTPTLQWTSVSGADYYAIAISKYPYGSGNIVYNPQVVYGTSLTVPSGTLVYGAKYRWNMQAHNSAGWSAISNTLYLQTPQPPPSPPSPPTAVSPGSSSAPGPVINTLTPTLQWTSVSGADYYAIAISKYPYGSGNIVYNPQVVYGTSLTVPSGTLVYGAKYRWNMQAHNSAGWSAISNTLYLQTPQPPPSPPSPPTAVSPGSSSAPGPVINTLTPTLQWTSVSGADYYAIAISKYPYGSGNIVYNPQVVYGTSLTVPSGTLVYGAKYRWNMQAHNSAGWSAISNTLYFQTPPLTLMLYVHEGSASGPVLVGARVTGQDGAGTSFDQTTNSSGYVVITGAPGTWHFTASKSGYQTNTWSQSITVTCTKHAYLQSETAPTAYIDSISPNPAILGIDTVSFAGHGTDPDGYVMAYEWRSSLDGQLSSSSSFNKPASELSAGTHTIYFKVKDDDGLWSAEVTDTLIIQPEALQTGTIEVTSDPSGAPFNLSGPTTYSGTTPWIKNDAPVGTYTITWGSMSGYDAPPSETQTLNLGGSITFSGIYVISSPRIHGIDVRDDINWKEVYNSNYRFAFVKATEGINWSKPGFQDRIKRAREAGLLVGVYHFGRPVPNKDKAKEEAESFVRLAGEYVKEGYLRPALDVEDSDYYQEYPEKLGKEKLAQWIKEWMDTVEKLTGVKPILYMNGYLFSFLSDSSIVNQYDIWIPDLTNKDPMKDNPNTRGWSTWAFWQYKQNVSLAGGMADLNVFNGDEGKLQNFVIKPNQPPVANASATSARWPEVFSGDWIYFDGSGSKDLDGTIVSYRWNFGDGETAEGTTANHRFRGATNEDKTYTVTLTVKDNSETYNDDNICITVTPLEKTVEVSHHPTAGKLAFARMMVTYNWIHDDTYVVSRIHYAGEFVGTGAISIWDFHSHTVPRIEWVVDIFSRGEKEEDYYPSGQTLYGGDTFEGVQVDAFDVMNIYIGGWAGISIATDPYSPWVTSFFFKTDSACFKPDYTEAPNVPIEAPSFDLAHLCSPGELRVYDSQGRVTGLVNGEVKEEIPYSGYDNNTVVIFLPSDSYEYKVVGTYNGTYGLTITSVENGEAKTLTRSNVLTSAKAVHQYTVDWDAIALSGGEGITIQIDSDGDGTFENTFNLLAMGEETVRIIMPDLVIVESPQDLPESIRIAERFEARLMKVVPEIPFELRIKNSKISRVWIDLKRARENVKMTIEKLGEKPLGLPDPSRLVWAYYRIEVNVPEDTIENAEVDFWIPKEWLATHEVSKEDIRLLRFEEDWEELKTEIVEENATHVSYRAMTPGFSVFAITAYAPAAFEVSSLTIDPVNVSVGEPVSIMVDVTNTGDITGTYTVALKIGGVVEATKNVTLAGGTTETVIFTVTKDTDGTYDVEIVGLMGTFTVTPEPIDVWLTSGIIAVLVIIGAIAVLYKRRVEYDKGTF